MFPVGNICQEKGSINRCFYGIVGVGILNNADDTVRHTHHASIPHAYYANSHATHETKTLCSVSSGIAFPRYSYGKKWGEAMTEKEKEIFYRLLVDLFLDNPQRREPREKKGQGTNEIVSSRADDRSAKSGHSQTATNQ